MLIFDIFVTRVLLHAGLADALSDRLHEPKPRIRVVVRPAVRSIADGLEPDVPSLDASCPAVGLERRTLTPMASGDCKKAKKIKKPKGMGYAVREEAVCDS